MHTTLMPFVDGEYVMAFESWPAGEIGPDADAQECIDPSCDECTVKFRPKRRRVSAVQEPAVEELAVECEEEEEETASPNSAVANDSGAGVEQRQPAGDSARRVGDEQVRTVGGVESFEAQGNAAWRDQLAEDGRGLQREQQALAATT